MEKKYTSWRVLIYADACEEYPGGRVLNVYMLEAHFPTSVNTMVVDKHLQNNYFVPNSVLGFQKHTDEY